VVQRPRSELYPSSPAAFARAWENAVSRLEATGVARAEHAYLGQLLEDLSALDRIDEYSIGTPEEQEEEEEEEEEGSPSGASALTRSGGFEEESDDLEFEDQEAAPPQNSTT